MEDEYAILSVPTPAGKTTLVVPPTNEHNVFTAGRAMSFWPVVNGNNATWLESEIAALYASNDDENLTFRGKLVNIDHEVGAGSKSIIIGTTIKEKYIPGVGVDVLNQLDRRQLERYEIDPNDFKTNGDYSKQSVEINCDRSLSKFIVMLKPHSPRLEDQKIYSTEEAINLGIRRTTGNDPAGPYMYDGKYKVVEACVPRRIRGIAMLGNPADTTANVYDVAASKEEDAAVKTGTTDTYDDSSQLDDAYSKVSPMSLSNEDTAGLDDGAFAVVQGGDEVAGATKPDIRVRSHPLYESSKHFYSGIPHKGLIKAALVGIGQDKDGKRPYKPDVHSKALQRVRSAHSQLTGDYSMSLQLEEIAKIQDPLKADIERLQTEMASHKTAADVEKAALVEKDRLKDEKIALHETEIAGLKAKIAEFEAKEVEAAALVVANTRLADLAKIDGFTVVDTEKAALIVELAACNEDQFKNRLLKEENASLARKLAAGGHATDEQAGLRNADHEGLKALNGKSDKIAATSAYAALFA